jgi:hypothetical protein
MDQLAPAGSFRLENQVAVVTGDARGIGAGFVRRFAQEGAAAKQEVIREPPQIRSPGATLPD